MYLQYRYTLEPSRAQHARLRQILALQRHLYNAALENRQNSVKVGHHLTYQDDCVSLGPYRRAHPEQAALPWGVNRWTLRRLDTAMTVYARRLRAGDEPGLPRFRSEARWRSFGVYGLKGWSLRLNRLCLDGISGALRVRMHRPLPAEAKPIGVTLTRQARRWFVTIMISIEPDVTHGKPETACGVNVGTNYLATLSDGRHFANIRPAKRKAAVLRRAARALARCQKGSRRRRKIRDRFAHAHRAVTNIRSNHLHQISADIVKAHFLVAVEDLNLKEMTRSPDKREGASAKPAAVHGLNRSMADAAPGRLLQMIRYKAEKAGGVMIMVDPRRTSQECHSCGILVSKARDERRHQCACGVDLDRDHNAALNILARGLTAHAAATGRRVGKALPNASLQAARPPRIAASAA